MKDLSYDERKELLGEVLADELKIIGEYVRDIPKIQDSVQQIHTKVDNVIGRLQTFEHV